LGPAAAEKAAARKAIEVRQAIYEFSLDLYRRRPPAAKFLKRTAWIMEAACENKSGLVSRPQE
jgi:hypothetical protein